MLESNWKISITLEHIKHLSSCVPRCTHFRQCMDTSLLHLEIYVVGHKTVLKYLYRMTSKIGCEKKCGCKRTDNFKLPNIKHVPIVLLAY